MDTAIEQEIATGEVKFFREEGKNFGFIKTPNGDVFFHLGNNAPVQRINGRIEFDLIHRETSKKIPQKGDRVVYKPIEGHKGIKALAWEFADKHQRLLDNPEASRVFTLKELKEPNRNQNSIGVHKYIEDIVFSNNPVRWWTIIFNHNTGELARWERYRHFDEMFKEWNEPEIKEPNLPDYVTVIKGKPRTDEWRTYILSDVPQITDRFERPRPSHTLKVGDLIWRPARIMAMRSASHLLEMDELYFDVESDNDFIICTAQQNGMCWFKGSHYTLNSINKGLKVRIPRDEWINLNNLPEKAGLLYLRITKIQLYSVEASPVYIPEAQRNFQRAIFAGKITLSDDKGEKEVIELKRV